jgi:hypothetical protein
MMRVIHYEISAENPERASEFYRKVFGWKFEKWQGPVEYFLIMTGEGQGIDGGLGRRMKGERAETVNTIDVSSVDEFSEKISKAGGKVVRPKMAVPGVGWLAYCQDTEGTLFGIMQDDPNAL